MPLSTSNKNTVSRVVTYEFHWMTFKYVCCARSWPGEGCVNAVGQAGPVRGNGAGVASGHSITGQLPVVPASNTKDLQLKKMSPIFTA